MPEQAKTYADFMNEISPSEVYEGLLAYGLFAEQLPPVFTSKPFFDYCQNGKPSFPKPTIANYIEYENMRNLNIPRPLGIPNPVAYHYLCKCIAEHWDKLQIYFQTVTKLHKHTVSRIHIRKMNNEPHLFEMNYKNWRIDGTPEPDLLIGAKYVVETDISKCFPSIYSHALCWALTGKEIAKQCRNDGKKWYNELDKYTRNISNGETHGLIIGPHTSNLLSEIILTKIDQVLYDKGYRYIRNVDDFSCYVEEHDKGQIFLVELNEQLRHYGFTLNHKKTHIKELPIASAEQWVHRINSFPIFSIKNKIDYKDVQAYLDLAVELMHINENNSAILKYAIKVLSKKQLTTNAKIYYVKIVLHLTLIYPYLVTLLDKYLFSPFSVDSEIIERFSQKLLTLEISMRNYEAASFAVYFAIKHNFILTGINFDCVEDSNHPILLLLCNMYHKKQGNHKEVKLYEDHAIKLMDGDMDAYWIFVYETLSANTLNNYWKDMKKAGVSFTSMI